MGNYKTRTCLEKHLTPCEDASDRYFYADTDSKIEYVIELLEDELVVSVTSRMPFSVPSPAAAADCLKEMNAADHFGYFFLEEKETGTCLGFRLVLWVGARLSDKALRQLFNAASSSLLVAAEILRDI